MPPTPTPLQRRRPTRPRALEGRVFSRSSVRPIPGIETGVVTIVATAKAIQGARKTKDSRTTAGAGDAMFAASPLSQSPAPSPPPTSSWPRASTSFATTQAPRKTPANPAAPAAPSARPTAATAAPRPLPRSPPAAAPSPTLYWPTAGTSTAPVAPRPLPRSPRFPAPQPAFAVGRFPSPPRGRGAVSATTVTPPYPPHMPTLSPSSPMETASASPPTSPSFATVARTTAATTAGPNTAASTTSATTTAATATTAPPSRPPKPAASRYPPLVVEVLPDWPTHFRELKKLLGHTPNGRPFNKGVRFLPKSDQEFRAIQRYLTQLESAAGISWFCYSLPAERSVKVAIRGLPANTEPAQVEQELRELGYVPEFVRSIPARPGRPGCLMFAQLQRTPNLTPGIYETRELLCMPGVTIEAWRGRKGAAQCHRCQQFRHSSHHCHRPIVCVRCGEGHTARDCKRPREEPATCANCGGAHTANNAACPAFRKETRNRRAGTVARTSAAAARPATSATVNTIEPNAPGSLMAAANLPQQQPAAKRRRRRGKRAREAPRSATRPAPQPAGEPASQSKPAVVATSEERTKAKRTAAPQPAPQPTRGPLDPRLTTVVGALNRVLTAIQEQRDPVPLILGCIAELCQMFG